MRDAEEYPAPQEFPAVPPGPLIPHQRMPVEYGQLPPLVLMPGMQLPPPPPRRGRTALLVGGVLALVAVLCVGAGFVYVVAARDALAERAEATDKPKANALPLTPYDAANATLEAQSAALLRGEEKGWIAALDPSQSKLRTKYHSMYKSLRALGVSRFEYHTGSSPKSGKNGTIALTAHAEYCFSTDRCPEAESEGQPWIKQELTFKSVNGKWLITAASVKKSREEQQPTPWESGELFFQQGKRVTLIAGSSERKYFKLIMPVAEKAAAVNDRFAGMVGNPQKKYRIYLAGAKQWKSWYGGVDDDWVIAYAMPLNEAGSDVVVNVAQVKNDKTVMASTIQHELGHVVTLGGAARSGDGGDMWLEEGIAEYIGWYPKPATASWRRSSVRAVVQSGKRPKSIAARALAGDASPDTSDAFYGLGHFAADCMARKYGQRALFDFVRLYLREDRDLEPASQEAFGKPFATVDKACVAWIRDQV
ncbi:hypothetical protein ACFQFC_22650 [Amorphoplanes digitatis]|uniref:Peptidase MA-like domain-containing protein n=1 Tax=Actinoplanes digitatis TaxID=1868 RepID=A0A7W7I5X7_9ACTN|nr:hypothetical protein [Actinoplanes digitatis]MBB4767023.1 hypothetical protein [Actinoplanes digitatis]GID95612.1 hypothetical protein Adi01nite_50240 [Actinoplanes digitatis]